MSRWFRWYEGTSEDGKFRAVARMSRVTVRDVIALWAFMLEDAAHLDHRGVCKRNEDFMASILDFEDGIVEEILSAMENVGMISVGHGDITLCNWAKRQFEGDTDPTAAERQRRHRERTKNVTNAVVTRDSRPPETDTDTDKKDIRAVAKTTRPNADFEEFWEARPRRKGADPKEPARKLYEVAAKTVPPAELLAALKRYRAAESERANTPFLPQMVKWLRDKRWNDYPVVTLVVSETNWRPILDSYKRFKHWPKGHGNEPGMSSCRAPPELLKEFGFSLGSV